MLFSDSEFYGDQTAEKDYRITRTCVDDHAHHSKGDDFIRSKYKYHKCVYVCVRRVFMFVHFSLFLALKYTHVIFNGFGLHSNVPNFFLYQI